MLLKLALRNLLRNKRRSIIAASSVLFAVVFAVFMRAIQFGAYDNMIGNIVGSFTGFLQIQTKDYVAEKNPDNALWMEELGASFSDTSNFVPRIEGFALCSHNDLSKPVGLIGINPLAEKNTIALHKKIIEGEYFSEQKSGLVVAKAIKELLKIKLGDSLVFFGQGAEGSFATGAFPVIGFADLLSPELNKRLIFTDLATAQTLFNLTDRASVLVVNATAQNWKTKEKQILSQLDTQSFALLNWPTMLPEINQLITIDKAGGTFVLVILYGIIAFSLFGTVLMLTEERTYEFGVLIAIGMQKKLLILVTVLEVVMLTFLGVLAGLAIAFPVVYYFHVRPLKLTGEVKEVIERFGFEAILPTSIDPKIAFTQAGIIFCITVIINAYVIWKINKTQPIKAMRA